MKCQIKKANNYITVDHLSETLDRTELEYGYSQLMDHALYRDCNIAICNFSSIKNIVVAEDDVLEIIHALSLIFIKKPDFHFIVVAPTPDLQAVSKLVHEEIRSLFDHPNLYKVDTLEEARLIAENIN